MAAHRRTDQRVCENPACGVTFLARPKAQPPQRYCSIECFWRWKSGRADRAPGSPYASRVYAQQTVDIVTALWEQGFSTAAIGERVDLSKNAVIGLAHRLGLRSRTTGTGGRKAGAPLSQTRKAVRARERRMGVAAERAEASARPLAIGEATLPPLPSINPALAYAVAAARKPAAPPERPEAIPPPIPPRRNAPSPHPGWGYCQFPYGSAPPYRWCGAPVVRHGSAWCPACEARVWNRGPRGAEQAA